MKFSIFAAVSFALICSIDAGSDSCTKSNTAWKECQSSTQPTCDDPQPKLVTADCRTGCFCKTGYVLDKHRDCIPVENCPPK